MPRRDFSKVAFAATGDVNTIPGTVQPDGSVSLPSGWGYDYERDNGAGGGTPDPLAKNIDREDMNGILNEITASIGEIQQNGMAIWATTAAPYPIFAEVRHSNINWRSLITNNSDTPGVGAGATSWKNISADSPGRLIGIQRFVANGTYTPTPGTTSIDVFVMGGGGGGGSNASTPSAGFSAAAQGGNAGASARGRYTSGFSGLAVTVGAGGAGGPPSAPGTNGSPGGATSLGGLISAQGGGGGNAGTARNVFPTAGTVNSTANTGSGGNVFNASGEFGGYGILYSAINISSGQGASTSLGGGGAAVTSNAGTQPGQPATGFGAGGGGACSITGAASSVGGVGAGGIVIIMEYS